MKVEPGTFPTHSAGPTMPSTSCVSFTQKLTPMQEADIQELRKRLIKQGRFTEEFLGADALQALQSADDGNVSPVLMEVLQIQARMSVPDAARRRVWELCASPSTSCFPAVCCIFHWKGMPLCERLYSHAVKLCVSNAGAERQDCLLYQSMSWLEQFAS
jgi:hypothetical protein